MKFLKTIFFLYLLSNIACSSGNTHSSLNKPLSFENLLELINSKPDTRNGLLKLSNFMHTGKKGKYSYTNGKSLCEGEFLSFDSSEEITYNLAGTDFKNHYDYIKKYIESKGFIFVTTKMYNNGLFLEIYSDTISNNLSIGFSEFHSNTAKNPCDNEVYSLMFLKKKFN